MYRHLTPTEIAALKDNLCIAEDWNDIYVKDGFNTNRIFQVSFSGVVKLGNFESYFSLPGGMQKRAGVRYATLHNVEVGDDCCVENIGNYIANYNIGAKTYIKNVSLMYVDGNSSFGNGTEVSVLNETGGREVPIHPKLSSHLAYFVTLYRHRPLFQQKIKEISAFYVNKHSANVGFIGENVFIVNVGTIKNVIINDNAFIEGTNLLENGTVNSNAYAPVTIGYNVSCKDFIISSGSTVDDGTTLERCFVGQACELTHGYSATDSLFFSNCFGGNGEACSIFAGPYTVTHHKSTLLIAGMYSFMNAGSGSNQSNHMYKLGPIHQGILERGVKTTSDSYILFPAQVGAFSLIMGRQVDNIDSKDLPFSYLIEKNDRTYIVPGVNLRSVGTIRDAQKWPLRDKRKDPNKLDFINFNLLSPFTIQKMLNGIGILSDIQKKSTDEYTYNRAFITYRALERGLYFYNLGVVKFLGNSLISRIKDKTISSDEELREVLKPTSSIGFGDWSDISGLIMPKSEVSRLIDDVENGSITALQGINDRFREIYENYYEYEWTWAYSKLFDYFGLNPDTITRNDAISIIEKWKDSVVTLDRMLYEDAKKEFSLSSMISFGVDGDREQSILDFEQVRGSFESNKFVSSILAHIEKKSELGDYVINQLKLRKCNS